MHAIMFFEIGNNIFFCEHKNEKTQKKRIEDNKFEKEKHETKKKT
jgi:hypothetical protein